MKDMNDRVGNFQFEHFHAGYSISNSRSVVIHGGDDGLAVVVRMMALLMSSGAVGGDSRGASTGITPFVTIFHWDLPQALEDDGGFLNDSIVNDFQNYADLCFAMFGDRVKHWITLNEPWSYSVFGYAYGSFPPNRCSRGTKREDVGFVVGRFARFARDRNQECDAGDSGVEPYNVSHNLLLSHAAAVQLYRQKYQAAQNGQIGISLVTEWMVPYDETSKKDQAAADRALAFMFMEPLHKGTYPRQMVSHVRDRLPNFTKEQSELVKGSFDFIGLNYYTAAYAANIPNCPILGSKKPSYLTDSCVNITKVKDGIPIGNETGSDWLYIYPEGIRDTLLYTKTAYGNPAVYVTENGVSRRNPVENLTDSLRMYYHQQHLSMLQNFTRSDASNVKGYFIWSLLDNFEWLDGYSVRFGIMYVDYNINPLRSAKGGYLDRTYKSSAR
ncbi:hypothetical protein RJ639_000160, partial [Escallonia herrerae]